MRKPRVHGIVRWARTDGRGGWALAGACAIGVLAAPIGIAATGDNLREGQRNPAGGGSASRETEIIANVNATNAAKGGYSTRQSNLSSTGGGAIYGCRSAAGGSAASPPRNPCLRANNLSTGYAFEFNASDGDVGGLFSVGRGGDSKRPFITNATGVALGLNADRVDGLDAAQIIAAAQAAGAGGPVGPQGPPGRDGVVAPTTALTPANATFGGVNVVVVDDAPLASGGPAATDTELVSITLQPGRYIVEGTAQFFDFDGSADAGEEEYGVARTFVGDTAVGTVWTPDIPDDGNNAAQATGSTVVQVTAADTKVSVRGIVRSAEGDGGQAGANIIATPVQAAPTR